MDYSAYLVQYSTINIPGTWQNVQYLELYNACYVLRVNIPLAEYTVPNVTRITCRGEAYIFYYSRAELGQCY